jgi:hypothetical protein
MEAKPRFREEVPSGIKPRTWVHHNAVLAAVKMAEGRWIVIFEGQAGQAIRRWKQLAAMPGWEDVEFDRRFSTEKIGEKAPVKVYARLVEPKEG